MSAGKFTSTFYQADSGLLHPIRVQPETLTASLGGEPNAIPVQTGDGVVKSKISARVNKGKRELGLGPRTVSIKYPDTDEGTPSGYARGTILTIPVLTPALWAGLSVGDSATYQGKNGTIVSTTPENVR